MLDVGQQQFLVLLFVVKPQLDELRQFRRLCIARGADNLCHSLIDLRTVFQHVLQ